LTRTEPVPDSLGERLTVKRVAQPDVGMLARLEEYDFEAFGGTGLRTYDVAVVAKAGLVLAAYVGDEIVGGCQMLRTVDEPEFFFVVGFYMRPGWRGRRLGKTLLMAVAQEALAVGAAGLVLTVSPDNKRALGLYRSVGFGDEGFVADFYGDGEHRCVLRWRFAQGDLHGSV
jgi:ribosomal protein S18 acetylase RimI-like enzyme